MKPTPKCSLFNPLSFDMVTNVALAKVCALPSARSSFLVLILEMWLDHRLFEYRGQRCPAEIPAFYWVPL